MTRQAIVLLALLGLALVPRAALAAGVQRFYLAGDASQAAVRVTGGSARVRLMIWRGGKWRER